MKQRLATLVRQHRLPLAGVVVLSVLEATLAVVVPLTAGLTVNAIVERRSPAEVVSLAVLGLAPVLFGAGAAFAQRRLASRTGEEIVAELRNAAYEHLHRLPMTFFIDSSPGALASRVISDVTGVRHIVTTAGPRLITNSVQLIVSVGAVAVLSWQVGLLALSTLPLAWVGVHKTAFRAERLQRQNAELTSDSYGYLTSRLDSSGALLVKLFGTSKRERDHFRKYVTRLRDLGIHTAVVMEWFSLAIAAIPAVAQATAYGVGGWLAVTGHLEPGTVVALALLLTQLYSRVSALVGVPADIATALTAFTRVFETLELEPEVGDPNEPRELPHGGLMVEFDDVGFGYPSISRSLCDAAESPRPVALHHVSFQASPGQVVALVGASGSGKSTIASLLLRLYDVDFGSVRLGGVDIRDLERRALRTVVRLVSQNSHLFNDTIAANLRYAKQDATDSELWKALDQAELRDFVQSLPSGLNTRVGDAGHTLSGGERQRLAIARVLLADPRVVVLDEATAHLDTAAQAAIHRTLSEVLRDRTALVIAHRLATIRDADVILVMDSGTIVERGTHAALLAAGGRYASLYRDESAADERNRMVLTASEGGQ